MIVPCDGQDTYEASQGMIYTHDKLETSHVQSPIN